VRLLDPGALRASRRSRIASMLAIAIIGSLFAFGTSAAAPSSARAADPPYLDVETYYLKLLNCTRTGGWVLSDGTCRGYGTGRYSVYVKPLARSSGISTVARRWAKYLAVNNRCVHGDVASRLSRAGYTSYRWAENIGCRDGYATARKAVLASHLKFQAEKSYNGGHWRNIKNARFTQVGIGVWRYGSRTRLVTDFYRP
jgi:Cysteine-rich secretory protein family